MLRSLPSFTAASAVALALFAGSASAATTNVLNIGDGGWTNGDTRNNLGVNVAPAGRVDLNIAAPGTAPNGGNSLRLTDDTASSKATLTQDGVSLGTIADFSGSYAWYKENAGAPAPAFKLGIDTTDSNPSSTRPNESAFDKYLIFEPYFNPSAADPGTGVWVTQTFDLNTGGWWLVDRNNSNLHVGEVAGVGLTLAQWLNPLTVLDPGHPSNPYAALLATGTIVNTQLGIGSGNANLVGYVNFLSYTYGPDDISQTYNFGATTTTVIPVPAATWAGMIGFGSLAVAYKRVRRRLGIEEAPANT